MYKKKGDVSRESFSEKAVADAISEPVAEHVKPSVVPEIPKKEAVIEKVEESSGNYLLRVTGLVPQIRKELDKLPPGIIPVDVAHESADMRAFGKQTYLFFMEKSQNPREKVILVDAVGLEDLARKIEPVYGKGKNRLVKLVSQPQNKRVQSRKVYLAIFVGE